eukprot:NODE_684_length_4771_cov_0.551156.p2 type:complete len:197 gc:universal NODE_684_length_4771_cov_0.551156:3401-3991(+)
MCIDCRVSWHRGYSCAEYQNLPPHLKSPEDIELLRLADHSSWKTCPKCKNMVEKREGCNHMTCVCKNEFFYMCGKQYKNEITKFVADCQCDLFEIPENLRDEIELPQRIAPVQLEPRTPLIGLEELFNNVQNRQLIPEWLHNHLIERKCYYCERVFVSLRALDQHLSSTSKHQVYQCCGRIYPNEHGLHQHRRTHN